MEYGQSNIVTSPGLILTGAFTNKGYRMMVQPGICTSQKHCYTHDCIWNTPPNKYSQVPSSPKVSHGILMITSVLAAGTFTGCPFPPHTTLPSLQLHTALPPQFCHLFQVAPHICLNHLVELAYWVENTLEGFWGLFISAHRPQPEITSLNKTSPWNSQHLW